MSRMFCIQIEFRASIKVSNHRIGILNIGKYASIIIVTKNIKSCYLHMRKYLKSKIFTQTCLLLTFTFPLLINIAKPPACMSRELVEVESGAHGVSRVYFFSFFFFRRSENICKYFWKRFFYFNFYYYLISIFFVKYVYVSVHALNILDIEKFF